MRADEERRLDAAGSLEERLSALESDRAIHRLLVDYATHADAQDTDALVGLFSHDAVLEVWPLLRDGVELGPARYEGHAGIRKFVEEGRRRLPASFFGASAHLSDLNAAPEISGTTATAETLTVTVLGPSSDRLAPALSGGSRNRWRFERIDGSWRIAGCVRKRVGTAGGEGS